MLIELERTKDLALVRSIITDRRIFGRMSDDYSPTPQYYDPPSLDAAIYVAVSVDDLVCGLWVLVPRSIVLFEIHTILLPEMWGEPARLAAPMMAAWTWENTECRRIFTCVPEFNRAAIAFAKSAGMKECGRHERAYMKRGSLHDLILLDIGKPEVSPCQ